MCEITSHLFDVLSLDHVLVAHLHPGVKQTLDEIDLTALVKPLTSPLCSQTKALLYDPSDPWLHLVQNQQKNRSADFFTHFSKTWIQPRSSWPCTPGLKFSMEMSNLYEVAPRPLMSSLTHGLHPHHNQQQQQPNPQHQQQPNPADFGGDIGDNETSIDLSAYIDPSTFNDDFLADLFHHNARQDKLKHMNAEYEPVQCGPTQQQLYMSGYMDSKLEPLYEPRIRPVAIKQEPRDDEDLNPAMPPTYHHGQQYAGHAHQPQQQQMPHLQYQIDPNST